MALEEFDFSKNYNFSGVFWFENEFNSRFSGTLPHFTVQINLMICYVIPFGIQKNLQ